MKKISLFAVFTVIAVSTFAQTPGYYNGTENKKGEELKTTLHNIIKGHIDFSYSDAKYILEYAQEDPNNDKNLIQFYTGRSVKKGKKSWGTGENLLNREHVWAASHGNFRNKRPMDGDAYNLHAADASVNVTRSNYDFDNVTGGTYIDEADARYAGGAFEPADREKGAVARTLFYMAIRYQGTNGELDLQMADEINTASNTEAKHGKLSTLLEWNKKYPPTDFEHRRNERVSQSQGNRNPFIDNPAFADLIWGNAQVSSTLIGDADMTPKHPKANENVTISAKITSKKTGVTAKLFWGKTYNSQTDSSDFSGTDKLSATMSLSKFTDNELVHLKIVTSDNESKHFSFYVAPNKTLTPITEVQGTGDASTMTSQIVTVSGVVIANFDNSFYLQSTGVGKYSGLCVYSNWRGHIGDSLTVTGKVVEYQNLTELGNITAVYNNGKTEPIKPTVLTIDKINEDYEGMLVELKDVNFVDGGKKIEDGGSFQINQGANSISMYVRYNARLIGHEIPNGTVNVVGVVSQYKNTYQLILDNINWVKQADDKKAPTIVKAEATSKDYVEITFDEKIKEESVTLSAFSIDGLTIEKATYYPESKVYLTVKGLRKQEYTVKVNGVSDLFGNVTNNATFTFKSNFVPVKQTKADNYIKIYPIPAVNNQIFVETNSKIASYKICNLTGQIVKKGNKLNSKKIAIPINNISNGSYLLILTTEDKIYKKVIIK